MRCQWRVALWSMKGQDFCRSRWHEAFVARYSKFLDPFPPPNSMPRSTCLSSCITIFLTMHNVSVRRTLALSLRSTICHALVMQSAGDDILAPTTWTWKPSASRPSRNHMILGSRLVTEDNWNGGVMVCDWKKNPRSFL
ncbi:hypothetical protein SCHPADRAFT_516621 [Schizopora paradoxa]|uniref:Uncharacterized protein n=1 Tax=Schizopora paradoxa TaxID=27342 RepID=A0A0H2S0F2_9AGAM|nr:hypothetical protein SCHPADRAFT_516621 [Schizopora paradoxa]